MLFIQYLKKNLNICEKYIIKINTDPRILVQLMKNISEQNKNPVRIEKSLVQQNLVKDKTHYYNVQLGSSTLILSKSDNSEFPKAQQQQIFEQLCHMEQDRKLYNQTVTQKFLGGSKSGISENILNRTKAGGQSENLKIIQKMDPIFHRRLERHFPDWEERMVYQKSQTQFLKSAMRKKKAIIKLRMIDHRKFYSQKELDAINYFEGKSFYAKYQELSVAPNIYDTRQSFLLKMHNISSREKFLQSFNRRKN
jgi:hypothetical protein